jgi:hypothetical protein
MGERLADWKLSVEESSIFRKTGFYYKKVQQGGLHGLPDFYQDAYHARSYVVAEWSRYFTPRAYINNGPMYLQDLVILERPIHSDSKPDAELAYVTLPVGAFNQPKIADLIGTTVLVVTGWTFRHGAAGLNLALELDGAPLGSCQAIQETPAVAAALPNFPEAKRSGFSGIFPIENISSGVHLLRGYVTGDPLPYLSTYFFTP